MTQWINTTHIGDSCKLMREMIADGVKVQCVVCSPPYWGLRDYGVKGQYGLERTWIRHVARMRYVFRLVRELLADDGVLWLNYGDSYYTPRINGGIGSTSTIGGKGSHQAFRDASRAMHSPKQVTNRGSATAVSANRRRDNAAGLKPKDLVGMAWRVALALQAGNRNRKDGWWLRSDIIWHKPDPMPESVGDRPTKTHEYVFLLSKSQHYYYDGEAIYEKATGGAHQRHKPVSGHTKGTGTHSAKDHARVKAGLRDSTKFGRGAGWRVPGSFGAAVTETVETRNARTVWSIPTQPFEGAHFATFPEALVARCVLAGSRPGDTIFDPFMGSGTVAKVATDLGRNFIGCDLNPDSIAMQDDFRRTTTGMPL